MWKPRTSKRDPIRQDPLRDPGQSLREKLEDVLFDKILFWLFLAAVMLLIAGLEWYSWLFSLPRSPVIYSIGAGVIVVIAAYRVLVTRHELARLKLGLRGERAMGQFLQEELSRQGYFVFHDICEDDYNIDHVLCGPGGLFSVETKTVSKPQRGETKVTFDDGKLLVNGLEPERDPIIQARAAAKRIREIMKEQTGQDVMVRAVVLFPDWFVEESENGGDVWILNEQRFVGYIRHEPTRWDFEKVKFFAAAIKRHIRSMKK